MDEDWRPDLGGVMAMRKAPSELPAAWAAAPYGVHLVLVGGETAIKRPAFACYVQRLLTQGIPVFLSAASPHLLLNEHLEADSDPAFLQKRLGELYALLHAARFGRSLFKRLVFLYRLQIDRQRQKYQKKSMA